MNTVLDPLRGDNEGMSYAHIKRWLLQNGDNLIHDASQDTPLGDLAMAVMERTGEDLSGHTLDTERKLRGAIARYQEAKQNGV